MEDNDEKLKPCICGLTPKIITESSSHIINDRDMGGFGSGSSTSYNYWDEIFCVCGITFSLSRNEKDSILSGDSYRALCRKRLIELWNTRPLESEARVELIAKIKLELLKLVKGLSDPEPIVEFNDVMDILTKLSGGAE